MQPDRTLTAAADRAIIGIAGIFFLNGAMVGSVSTHFAVIKSRLDIEAGTFSLLVMAMAIGTICALLRASSILGRFGSAGVIRVCIVFAPALLIPLTLLGGPVSVAVALFLFGAFIGLLDTAMNVHASLCETVSGKLAMVRIHAAWSVGGIVGALTTGMVLDHFPPVTHAVIQAIVMISLGLGLCLLLLPAATDRGRGVGRLSWPSRPLVPLAAMAFLLMICVATMRDWSAIYLHETYGSDYRQASLAFAAFSAMTAFGRLFGDRLRSGVRDRSLLIVGGIFGGVVLLAGLLIQDIAALIVAIGLLGLCHSILTPMLISLAGKHDNREAATNIASVMMVGFLGYVVGPPLIGLIAQAQGLGFGFALTAALSIGIGLIAQRWM